MPLNLTHLFFQTLHLENLEIRPTYPHFYAKKADLGVHEKSPTCGRILSLMST